MDHFPQWTSELTDTTVKGEDQLGVEGAAQSYQQEILPGIITVTEHARYYSFYAWILYRFIFGKGSKRQIQDFRGPFFRRHEMALILAAYQHHNNGTPFSGVVGSGNNNSKVKRFWTAGEQASLDQDYFQNKEGGFGQYYRSAMQAMGILEEPENSNWVYRLTDRGKSLAEAYETSIKETVYFQTLELNGQVSQINLREAEEYGQVGCICPQALSHGQDRGLLLDTFFRFEDVKEKDNPHARRRNSLGVALDLVHQANGQFKREYLRPALYIGEYSPSLRYQPSDEILDWVKRWQMVEVRHIFTFGIQCLWAAFLLELRAQGNIKKDVWQTWMLTRLNDMEWNKPLKSLVKELFNEAGIPGDFDSLLIHADQTFGLQSGLDEYSLFIKATRNQSNASVLFKTGVRVLLQLYLRFYQNYKNQESIWKEMAQKPRLPLNSYFSYMEKGFQNSDWLAKDWLTCLYQDYIFEQHEMIALEKLRYQEYDTFKFYFEAGSFHWPAEKKPYKEPIRLAGNRLNNCITMMIDLGLINEGEEESLTLSPQGKEFHAKILRELRNDD